MILKKPISCLFLLEHLLNLHFKNCIDLKFLPFLKLIPFSWRLLILCIIFSLSFIFTVNLYSAEAATYKTIWFLGHSPTADENDASGVIVIYTYPDAIEKGKKFDVGVTLEYRKDSAVVSNWLAFTNVSISIKNYSSPYDKGILDAHDNLAAVVRPGEKYAHSFTLTAPETQGKYLVFPKWTAWFGPGKHSGKLRMGYGQLL